MCKVFKFLFKLIRILAVAVGALFVVYFWNLDQKLLGWAYLVMGVLNGLILIFVRPLVGIYELSGETMELSIILACIHAGFAMLLWPLSFVLPNALRAANDVKFTMCIALFSMFTFRLLLSYIIGLKLGMGAIGVWIAMIVDWVFRAVAFCLRYRGKRWLSYSIYKKDKKPAKAE